MTADVVEKLAYGVDSGLNIVPSLENSIGKIYGLTGTGSNDIDAAIKALFALGEQGAWYDPSDFSTMFQDSTGTTPVTAVGQPVGLILDKSNGLALGSELVTVPNSGLASGLWNISGGVITRNGSATGQVTIATVDNTPYTGEVVRLGFSVSGFSGDSFFLRVGNSGVIGPISANGNYIFYPVSGVSNNVVIAPWAGTAGQATITNVTTKYVAGNHASQATTAARPVLTNNAQTKQYRDFDAVDDSHVTTFPSSLGSSCTVARANPTTGASILTGQTIGTSFTDSNDSCALIIVNRALTGQETTDLTAWLNAKAGV